MSKLFPYFWSLLNTGGAQIIGFLASLIIARSASPADFGVLALCSSIILIFNIFAEGGLATVLVVDQRFCSKKASTAVFITTLTALFISLITFVFATFIAEVLGDPRISYVMPIMTIATIASALGCVHSAYITRTLQFKKKAGLSLASSSIGSSLGVFLAYSYNPLTGLVVMYVIIPCLITAGLWATTNWGFHITFKPKLVLSNFKFSFNIAAAHLLDQASKSIVVLFLNKNFGIDELGLYNRGEAIRNITTQTADKVVQRVSFPVLSETGRNEGQSSSFLASSKISAVLLLILVPVVYILSDFSSEIISILFGPRWSEVSPILQIIALMGLFIPLTSVNFSFMKSSGDAYLVTKNKILALLCYCPLFVFAFDKELDILLLGIVLHSGFMFTASVFSLSRLEGVQLGVYFRHLAWSFIVAGAAVLLHKYLLVYKFESLYEGLALNLASLILVITLFYYIANLIYTRF